MTRISRGTPLVSSVPGLVQWGGRTARTPLWVRPCSACYRVLPRSNEESVAAGVGLRLDFDRFPRFEDNLRIEREFVLVVSTACASPVLFGPFEKAEHSEIGQVVLDTFQRCEWIVPPTTRDLLVRVLDLLRADGCVAVGFECGDRFEDELSVHRLVTKFVLHTTALYPFCRALDVVVSDRSGIDLFGDVTTLSKEVDRLTGTPGVFRGFRGGEFDRGLLTGVVNECRYETRSKFK